MLRRAGTPTLHLAGALEQPEHDVAGALAAALVDQRVEGVEPVVGLVGVDVGQLGGQALVDHRAGSSRGRWLGRCSAVPVVDVLGHRLIVARAATPTEIYPSSTSADRGRGLARVAPSRGHGLRAPRNSAGLLPTLPPRPRVRDHRRTGGVTVSSTAGGGSTQTDGATPVPPSGWASSPAWSSRSSAGTTTPTTSCGSRSRTRIDADMVDGDYGNVVDAVLLWWRDEDGDLVDGLVDSLTDLVGGGAIWLLTPKVGPPNAVDAADIAEAGRALSFRAGIPRGRIACRAPSY